MRKLKRTIQKANGLLNKNEKAITVMAAALAPAMARAQSSTFDVSTLYAGVAGVFLAAATVAGGFLAVKFGAKMIKKAWAWLT